MWHVLWLLFQDDLSVLRIENAQLQDKEQQMSFHMRQFEVDQQRHVEESLRLRGELDRCRQDLTHQDTEKRGLTHQISEKQSEAEQLREQLSGLQNQLDTEAKSKNRKSYVLLLCCYCCVVDTAVVLMFLYTAVLMLQCFLLLLLLSCCCH